MSRREFYRYRTGRRLRAVWHWVAEIAFVLALVLGPVVAIVVLT